MLLISKMDCSVKCSLFPFPLDCVLEIIPDFYKLKISNNEAIFHLPFYNPRLDPVYLFGKNRTLIVHALKNLITRAPISVQLQASSVRREERSSESQCHDNSPIIIEENDDVGGCVDEMILQMKERIELPHCIINRFEKNVKTEELSFKVKMMVMPKAVEERRKMRQTYWCCQRPDGTTDESCPCCEDREYIGAVGEC